MTPASIPQATAASTPGQSLSKNEGRRSRIKGRNQGTESKTDYAKQGDWSPGEGLGSYLGRIGKTPLLTAAEEIALVSDLRSALEKFLRHLVGSLTGVEKLLELADETRDQRKRAKASVGGEDISQIEADCRAALSAARNALTSLGWVPSEVAGKLMEHALKLALGLRVRVTQAIRIFEEVGKVLALPERSARVVNAAACPTSLRELLDTRDPHCFWATAISLSQLCIRLRDRLVECNLRLVVSEVANLNRSGFSKNDLIQEGNIGLIKAAESFDGQKKFRFTSFAVHVIRSEVNRAYSNTARLIRLPVYQCEALGKLEGARKLLERSSGGTPGVSELAQESGLKESAVKELSDWRKPILSLEAPLGGESDRTLADTLVDPGSLPRDAGSAGVIALVERGLQTLPPVERQLLSLRHGLEGDLPDGIKTAAERLGLSVAIAQALETKAVEHLRRSIRKGPAGFEWNE